ncbi:unnamed protein product [Closterium sp. NIES-54]
MARLPALCLASVILVLVCCSEAVRLVPSSRSTVARNSTTGSNTANTGSSTGYADSATTTGAIARGINSTEPTRTRPKAREHAIPYDAQTPTAALVALNLS